LENELSKLKEHSRSLNKNAEELEKIIINLKVQLEEARNIKEIVKN